MDLSELVILCNMAFYITVLVYLENKHYVYDYIYYLYNILNLLFNNFIN